MSARNKELLNLGFAALVASAAFASVSIVGTGLVTTRWLGYVGVVFGLYLVAHVVARFTVPYADPTLLPLVGLLTALGLTVIYRLESRGRAPAGRLGGPRDRRPRATLFWLRFDYRVLERYKYLFGISAVVLLLLPSVPGLGHRVNGVKLWIKVGPMQFQPGELAKIFMIIFLAGYLRDKREALAQGRLKDLGPLLLIWGASMLVLVQTSDLGSALLNFGIFLAMVYAATGRFIYVGAGLALFVAGSAALYNALDRVQQRVTVWLHPWTDERVYCSISGKLDFRQNCDSYQLVKSLYSIANGGYGGTGLGKGTFTTVDGTQLIPYLNTDFIYSAIAQEVGLIGSAAVLLLVMVFVARGMRIALIAQDGFSKLLATGLTFGLALQTFIIVGGVLRVVPLTGITLPFVSYGGSSILSNFVMLALLLLVSNRAAATAVNTVNRQISRVAGLAMGLMILLIVATTYWQTWARPALAERQDNAIQRVAQFEIKRGPILSPSRVLARNKERRVGDRTFYLRRYPQGRLTAHVVGYSTVARARTGLERSLNSILTGSERSLSSLVDRSLDRLNGRPIVGDTVVTTLDVNGQRAALEALGTRCGAVVVLDPRTGRVRVMVSSPSYNPNDVEENFGRIEKIRADCTPASPLLNRASQGLYPPGSTFKVVTASAALDSRKFTTASTFYDPGYCSVYGKRVNNFDTSRPFGNVTLATALQYSVNSVFCNIGLKLGARAIVKQAKAFGFYERPPLETPESERLPSGLYKGGELYDPRRDRDVDPGRMAFGQERLLVTPLQMAMVAGAIGNDGILMRPFVVEKTVTPERQDPLADAPDEDPARGQPCDGPGRRRHDGAGGSGGNRDRSPGFRSPHRREDGNGRDGDRREQHDLVHRASPAPTARSPDTPSRWFSRISR